jgi:hypothetical protein
MRRNRECGGRGEQAGRREHQARDARLRRQRLRPPADEVGEHGHDARVLPVVVAGPRPQQPGAERGAERGVERVDVRARRRVVVGGGGERQRPHRGGMRGEERRRDGRGRDGKPDAARGEERGEVQERLCVAAG